MANEFRIKNGLVVDQGNSQITGSLIISGSNPLAATLPTQDIVYVVTYNPSTNNLGYINATSGTSGIAGSNYNTY